jgi:hypothetical protein
MILYRPDYVEDIKPLLETNTGFKFVHHPISDEPLVEVDFMSSIAMSAKRIADALEKMSTEVTITGNPNIDLSFLHSQVTNLAYEAGINFGAGSRRDR